MSARRFALLAAFAFFVGFVALNLTANSWLKSWRLDLTENHLYSLSPGTERTLDELTEPVELTLYYSRDSATAYPPIQAYATRVREMLQTYAARSHGRVRFVEVNVKPFSEEEDKATEAGIQPMQVQQGADPIYLGLVASNAIDDHAAIPFFNPQQEPFVEYEVTRLIYTMEHTERTKVALITALPFDPAAALNPETASGQPELAQEMGRAMDVTKLPADFTEIPAGTDVLAIIHPGPLTPAQAYAIDQFILRRGRAFIAIDPASMSAAQQGGALAAFNPEPTMETASTLEPMLSRWGVQMSNDVVLDMGGAIPIPVPDQSGQQRMVPYPLFIRVPAEQDHLDREDMMTAWLNRGMQFGAPGALSVSPRPGVEITPLVRTSPQTRHLAAPIALMQPSPYDLINDWPPGGRIETIAVRLSGPLETAFPGGAPEGAAPPPEGQERLTRSATPAQLVIVADTDFIDDLYYIDQSHAAYMDNGAFVLNAIDVLAGSDALVSLRSRAPATREMTRVKEMEEQAQRSIERRQQELQGELQRTEDQLAELQARGRGSGYFAGNLGAELTPEERATLEGYLAEVTRVRTELRGVERNLRGDVNRLETLVVFINVWLAPILVAAAGLFLFWRRQRRTRRGAPR